jgi:hypothetical protein
VLFDRYIMVDWNASKNPRTRENSVWVCVLGADGHPETENPLTRGKAEAVVRKHLYSFVSRGERILIGFDFPYGYPVGLTAALGLDGPRWLALWRYLVSRVEDDGETNRSNRFQVAADINARLGRRVFWGHEPGLRFDDLSPKRDRGAYRVDGGERGLAEWREVELILHARGQRPQSAWKLWGAGCVGSQALTGIPVVSRLRHDDGLKAVSAVWPFEVSGADLLAGRPAVIHAEIWPSLIDIPSIPGQVKDETQVISLAGEFRERDRAGNLTRFFAAPSTTAVSEEGWILGVASNTDPYGRARD